ncbi:hypothetical protein CRE_25854 [Caenorhabditis remanei]|uniref:Uncharacterized protein n=1 Tax=Caenorhabditis remanei TaxID=31234 RepID=E3NDR2_CAERE|nr:hypothetical protein CRE_25854 [Caenorhabditis remanei]
MNSDQFAAMFDVIEPTFTAMIEANPEDMDSKTEAFLAVLRQFDNHPLKDRVEVFREYAILLRFEREKESNKENRNGVVEPPPTQPLRRPRRLYLLMLRGW